MELTKQDVREVIDVYIKAWTEQDPDLIVTIFTPAATYHERVMADPIPDRDAIRRYWQTKVVGQQANITCRLETSTSTATRPLPSGWQSSTTLPRASASG